MTTKKFNGDDVFQMLCQVMESSLNGAMDPAQGANAVGAGKAIADIMKQQLKANEHAAQAKEMGHQLKHDGLDHYGGSIVNLEAPIIGQYPGMSRQRATAQPAKLEASTPEFESQDGDAQAM